MCLRSSACVRLRVRVRVSACVRVRLRVSVCVRVCASAPRKLNVRTHPDAKNFCVQTHLLFKDFRDVLYVPYVWERTMSDLPLSSITCDIKHVRIHEQWHSTTIAASGLTNYMRVMCIHITHTHSAKHGRREYTSAASDCTVASSLLWTRNGHSINTAEST